MTEWDGVQYSKLSALQRAMATDAVASIALTGDEWVLDVGCGDGFVTRLLASRVPDGQVIGIDPSSGMLGAAHTVSDTGRRPLFARADARALPLTQAFDVVVSFNALHWVPQQRQALEQIDAVTRPGARVLIQMVCANARASVESTAMDLTREPQWASAFDGFAQPFVHPEPERYRDLAVATGFAVTALEVTDREWDFGTRDAFESWCEMGITAWTDRLPPARRHQFAEDLVDRYQPIAERPGLFRYSQMRAELAKPMP